MISGGCEVRSRLISYQGASAARRDPRASRLDEEGRPRKLLFLLLIEHQSSPDPTMVWPMQHYVSSIQKRYLKRPAPSHHLRSRCSHGRRQQLL